MKLIKNYELKKETMSVGDIITTQQDSYIIELIDIQRGVIDLVSLDTEAKENQELEWLNFNGIKEFTDWTNKNSAKHYSKRKYNLKLVEINSFME